MPDLVILDPCDLEEDLDQFCSTLSETAHKPRLLSYSFTVSRSAIQDALAAGFHGCMSKYSNLHQLEAAVAAVLGGGVYFDPRFAELLWPAQNKLPDDVLSLREKEVLVRTAKGLASKQIAIDLDISAKTVETYKARAVQKLGLSDRSKVFDYALEQGWIN
jgi:DNA-binding NarL/FixJ family response regulator